MPRRQRLRITLRARVCDLTSSAQSRTGALLVEVDGKSEVGQFDLLVGKHQDVLWLDVSAGCTFVCQFGSPYF